ncbi:hypothetical protein PBCV1_a690dR [Paramecium bursaria Chlorella virus 1]|uniref:Uncharacterized protein n=1 Tax=Paramecium bursaria Chlorella virus 1 TaxID=10506 RepID=F8TTV7_PBCV1|nr:hypothetical protein PBCV1_a002dR [Paramecium bursaria Chlorella virus 1]YP_004679008.1 hypothetical protein PBCV1_a690dR [Paramecium bursaria Chlorella virus 1]AEI70018.1 hypothetical protein [Paramecium bursaria Chlorella virus 1]AEI70153.1 hypothetical protein [Paramecium bursaria Chlorella virus 1]
MGSAPLRPKSLHSATLRGLLRAPLRSATLRSASELRLPVVIVI